MVELISVHVPKCAGLSLKEAYLRAYGENNIFFDYADSPFNPLSPINIDPQGHIRRFMAASRPMLEQVKLVHGHFHINKYDTVTGPLRVTILRDPIDRLLSHYYYWKSTPTYGQPVHEYFNTCAMTLLELAQIPSVTRYYTDVFFRDVDMGMFDFIGTYDTLHASIAKIGTLAGKNLEVPHINKSIHAGYEAGRAEALADTRQMAAIRDALRDDIAFYERWSGK